MRPSSMVSVPLCVGLLNLCCLSTAAPSSLDPRELVQLRDITERSSTGHHHHGDPHAQPLTILNETEILQYHQPTPPSYYSFDWEGDVDPAASRHPGLMVAHIVFMSLAYFVALPIGIILRSLKHPARFVSTAAFWTLAMLGVYSSTSYRKMTPNMYEGSVHGKHGYFILLVSALLSGVDFARSARRVLNFLKGEDKSLKHFWRSVVLHRQEPDLSLGTEYASLIVEEPEAFDFHALHRTDSNGTHVDGDTEGWVNNSHRHRRLSSLTSAATKVGSLGRSNSDETLHETTSRSSKEQKGWKIWMALFIAVVESTLAVAGLTEFLSGIVVYTGGCRQSWINGCLAHLIKGGIFWCYGLLTFARFLGAFAARGWAWNRSPSSSKWSAEFVESFVIFLYGITNTWMERFGAHPGDPYTTKQIQHISIAVMFWFAGLIGMGIESRRVRGWLASSAFSTPTADKIAEPPSYSGSFNPFPALVIGVTGAAMAAHFQTYLFQVQIHSLWGNLLVGFSVLRCLTYFFLWLSPPRSILPSRPPTEAIGSFFLTCGGLVFMFSTEEFTLAAMRRGRDDVMMFLNVAVAMTCLAFCWMLFLVGLKGLLKSRAYSSSRYRTALA